MPVRIRCIVSDTRSCLDVQRMARQHRGMSALLLTGIGRLVTMDDDLGVIEDAQIFLRNGVVEWIGQGAEEPPINPGEVVEGMDCGGRAVLPGLVDAHTHLVFGGDRSDEFARRSAGESYETIAKAGGGIQSTVRATRLASEEELYQSASRRLDAMCQRGVTTVEVKSGYGLDLETELKMLRVIRRLADAHPMHIVSTFLGAHTVPSEYLGKRERYLDIVCEEMLPQVAEEGLATFCDVFCEEGVFTIGESRRVLERAMGLGLAAKVHGEQLHRTGATQLAVELGAVSVDHLERADDSDIRSLADHGETTAVLLPGATLFLGWDVWAPARALLDAGVTVALATDCNPGSCMCDDLPLITTLACTRLGMSPAEALRAVTRGGAHAVGCGDTRGRLAIGYAADVCVLDVAREDQLPYRFGRVAPYAVICGGVVVTGPGMLAPHAHGMKV
jgi:imidazolonepropionase